MPISARSRGRVTPGRVSQNRRRHEPSLFEAVGAFLRRQFIELAGIALIAMALALVIVLLTYSPDDPSLNHATASRPSNFFGGPGAVIADLLVQSLGLGAAALVLPLVAWGWHLLHRDEHPLGRSRRLARLLAWPIAVAAGASFAAAIPAPAHWPITGGLGGFLGGRIGEFLAALFGTVGPGRAHFLGTLTAGTVAIFALASATGFGARELWRLAGWLYDTGQSLADRLIQAWRTAEPWRARITLWLGRVSAKIADLLSERFRDVFPIGDRAVSVRHEPAFGAGQFEPCAEVDAPSITAGSVIEADDDDDSDAPSRVERGVARLREGRRAVREAAPGFDLGTEKAFELPPLSLLVKPKPRASAAANEINEDALEQNARLLEAVLDDFGVRGEILKVRPGPVVTLYELRPAPGIKSSRVISLADDIARSMSAVSARVAVIPGRNVIGIELPNQRREMVFLRELLSSTEYENASAPLALALGKTIGGEPVLADLGAMPHLLVAGTTGSGKSVAINTMILSLLYRLTPEQCRMILVDPKMLELSVYDGIPHLLAPVVTEPKKAVGALKWVVKEMEDRYRRMSKLGVRNIAGFNARLAEAADKGEVLRRTVQTGFDKETGRPVFEHEELDFEPLPLIVVVVDEMADLMMVAGKDIEAAVQRLAQMARAAGIHLITATQRPSVDVITGTIKANFPTRISFQVTSKIDSRTILGEQGAEQLLGQGDMLYMAGGGRIRRVHGPFVSDEEVEEVVNFLKRQAAPDYLEAVTETGEDDEDDPFAFSLSGDGSGDELYDQAVAIVARDRRVSTSYIQRRLQIGYNRAARMVEQMEEQGVVTAPNRQGKREILIDEIED